LSKKGYELSDVKELEVDSGPGSFTGIRVGVAVANAIGWALRIPVNGKRIDKGESVDIEYENK
jgi:tRNA A37 threonylcarbamoyladenosine modification protein TsaB